MAYATRADIDRLYGASAVKDVALLDTAGNIVEEAVSEALIRASGEVDTYLSQRYEVPLLTPPTHVVQVTVDVALYRMALTVDRRTLEHRVRYDDALTWLRSVAAGKAGIGVDEEDDDTIGNEGGGGLSRPHFAKTLRI